MSVLDVLVLLPALALIGWGLWLWAVRAGRLRAYSRATLGGFSAFMPGDILIPYRWTHADPDREAAHRRWPWDATADLDAIDWRMEP